MTVMERVQFAEAFARLSAAFGRDVDDDRLEAYREALESLPLVQLEAGMRRAALEERYFPPPKVIREWAKTVEAERGQQARARAAAQARAAGLEEQGATHCGECADTGWIREDDWCAIAPGAPGPGRGWYLVANACVAHVVPPAVRGRYPEAAPDWAWYARTAVHRCGCWELNPILQARRGA